jgi:ketosteroid isomerase-like protein
LKYNMNNATLDTAMQAFRHFAHGWATGDFQPYIAMLAEGVEFSFPDGPQRGHYTGVEGRRRMIAKCRGDAESGARLTLHPPHHITSSGTTTLFEFIAEGRVADRYYRGEIAIVLEVGEGNITGFREYYGVEG